MLLQEPEKQGLWQVVRMWVCMAPVNSISLLWVGPKSQVQRTYSTILCETLQTGPDQTEWPLLGNPARHSSEIPSLLVIFSSFSIFLSPYFFLFAFSFFSIFLLLFREKQKGTCEAHLHIRFQENVCPLQTATHAAAPRGGLNFPYHFPTPDTALHSIHPALERVI